MTYCQLYRKADRRATFKAIAFAGYSYVSKSTCSLGITGKAHLSFKVKRRPMLAVSRNGLRASMHLSLHQQSTTTRSFIRKKGKIYKDKSSICTVPGYCIHHLKIDSSALELKAANQYPTRNLPQ